MNYSRTFIPKALALAAAMAASQAHAVDFDGYFRAGPGATSKNAARACYNLGGVSAGHYRLGNECDFYGEFGLAHTGTMDGVSYKAKVMVDMYNNGTDTGGSKVGIAQMYAEGKGFDVAPETNFWIGKRFYGRADVHILDAFFTNLTGVGAGADNIAVGSGGAKLAVAYFGADGKGNTGSSTNPGSRFNVELYDLAVNPGGKLRITGTATKGRFDNPTDGKGTSGFGLGLKHTQDLAAIGGANTAWLQYAQGSAGLNGNFGTMNAPSSARAWRLVESLTWQVGKLGGQAVAVYGQSKRDSVNNVAAFKEFSIGGRASYAVTKNFKLIGEVGHMEKRPDGGATQKLTKVTFAPTLSTGPGFWNRPELRLYVTHGKWNAAANAAAGAAGLTGLNNGKTSGTSFGAQVEMWF